MEAQRRSRFVFVRRHDARFYFDDFPKSGFRTACCSYSLAILTHHCGRLSTIFKPRFATCLVATISFELCAQFRAPYSALCSAPCSALCTLVLCALRLAPPSALCCNTTLTSTQPRLHLGYSFAIWSGGSLVLQHPFRHIPVVTGRPSDSPQVDLDRPHIAQIWPHHFQCIWNRLNNTGVFRY
jgi:hypothetical protein